MEKVGESKGPGTDDYIEVESKWVVKNKKTRGVRGRKKRVCADSLENFRDAVVEEMINHEVLERECSEKVVDSREQPCDEPADDASEKSLHDDMKTEQFMEVEVPKLERDALSVKEKHCAELMDEFHHLSAESLENVCGAATVEKLNHGFLQNEISQKSLYVCEQPCDEPVDDPPEQSVCDEPVNDLPEQSFCNIPGKSPIEQSVLDEMKIGQLMEVDFSEQGVILSMSKKPRAELMDDTSQRDNGVSLPVDEQQCTKLMDESNQQHECVSLPMKEKCCVELMVVPTQHDDCDAGLSHVEEGVCDGLGSDAVFDDGRTEKLEIEEIDKESEANCCGRNEGPETADMPNLEKMTLGDWFTFLETYLPQQIRVATDEIIEEMKKKICSV